MKKRRFVVMGLGAIGALLILVISIRLLNSKTSITYENFEKIQEGMTLAEVETILGGPARTESSGPLIAEVADDEEVGNDEMRRAVGLNRLLFFTQDLAHDPNEPPPSSPLLWESNHVLILVCIDSMGCVEARSALEVRPLHASPWDIICRWFQLSSSR